MTTHTPSPWQVNKTWGTIEGPRGQEVCAIFPADESGRREPRATAQANARLIAAAPELLEALEIALKYMPDWTMPTREYNKARAAIAKAKGE